MNNNCVMRFINGYVRSKVSQVRLGMAKAIGRLNPNAERLGIGGSAFGEVSTVSFEDGGKFRWCRGPSAMRNLFNGDFGQADFGVEAFDGAKSSRYEL